MRLGDGPADPLRALADFSCRQRSGGGPRFVEGGCGSGAEGCGGALAKGRGGICDGALAEDPGGICGGRLAVCSGGLTAADEFVQSGGTEDSANLLH